MKEMGFPFLAKQLEDRMAYLKGAFRQEYQRRNTTGAPGPSKTLDAFPYYEDMEAIMGGDVTVQPILTISAGSSNVTKERKEVISAGGGLKIKKTSSPLKERSVTALELVAESMRRRVDLLESSLSPK